MQRGIYPCVNKYCPFRFNCKLAQRNHVRSCSTPDKPVEFETTVEPKHNQIPFDSDSPSTTGDYLQSTGEESIINNRIINNTVGEEQQNTAINQTDPEEESIINNAVGEEQQNAAFDENSDPISPTAPQAQGEDDSIVRRQNACLSLSIGLYRLSRKAGIESIKGLIALLNDENLKIEDVRNSISSFHQCKRNVQSRLSSQMVSGGFVEHRVVDDADNECSIFTRNIVDVIREQVRYSNRSEIYLSVSEAVLDLEEDKKDIAINSHPIAAGLGRNGIDEIISAVQASSDLGHVWHSSTSSTPSCPGFVQLYSDKSHSTLRALSFTFYPVHAVLLNFKESVRRRLIVSGKTIVGYLPTKFLSCSSNNSHQSYIGLSRSFRIRLLHLGITKIIQPLHDSFFKGFDVETKDSVTLKLHSTPANYVADVPEAKDMTAVRHNTTGTRNCYRCVVLSSELSSITNSNLRLLKPMDALLKHYKELMIQSNRSTDTNKSRKFKIMAKQTLNDYSIEPYAPALSNGPLTLKHSFDPYQIFTFDTLHAIHLGLTKTQLILFHQRVKALTSRPTSVLNRCNHFLREVDQNFRVSGPKINFECSGKSPSLNGLFTDDGIIGMLEGKHYKQIETLLPFLGAICDRFIRSEGDYNSQVTHLFTTYVDMLHMIFRSGRERYWTYQDKSDLETHIKCFKYNAVKLFKPYQKSNMKLIKFHLLDHLMQDLETLGSVSIGSSNLFEFTHTLFKRLFNTTSKREIDGLRVTVERMQESLFMDNLIEGRADEHNKSTWDHSERKFAKSLCPSALNAMNNDASFVVSPFFTVSLKVLHYFIYGSNPSKYSNIQKKTISNLNEIQGLVGRDHMDILYKEIISVLKENCFDEKLGSIYIGFSKSFHIASILPPSLSSGVKLDDGSFHVHVKSSSKRYIHRIVSALNYRNSTGVRQNFIMLLNDSCEHTNADEQCLWFGKVKAIITISGIPNSSVKDRSRKLEFAFVQYLDPFYSRDDIDNELGCIRLRWERANEDVFDSNTSRVGKRNRMDPGQWLGLTPIQSVLGMLPLVPADRGIDCISFDGTRENGSTVPILYSSIPWYDQSFYVNRFLYLDHEQLYSFHSE